jgi:hypothetical protein
LDEAGLAAPSERAGLRSATAAAYMLDRRLDEAIEAGGMAEPANSANPANPAGVAEDEDLALNTAATLGSVLVFAGRSEEGWHIVEQVPRPS